MKGERITPFVTQLDENQVFVFGSNEVGRHGKGAAKLAKQWGAKIGVGEGLSGKTYGIPTKDKRIQTMSKGKILKHVDTFMKFASQRVDLVFLVTEIGCGLAGYSPSDIAPMFVDALHLTNVFLPLSFWEILSKDIHSRVR